MDTKAQNRTSKTGPTIEPSAKRDTTDTVKTMRELRAAAGDAFDTNHPVEALRDLIALLAVDEQSPPEVDGPLAVERDELVRAADVELTSIGSRLTLEPADEWISEGIQTAANVRDLAKGSGRMPSARLLVNYDYGKAVVADAPIRFAFVDGIGEVTNQVLTDSYGIASATVRSVARADRPAVVRATLVVSNRGKTRVFNDVSIDFTYLAAIRQARIFALERPSSSESSHPSERSPLVDSVARALAPIGLDLLPWDGTLDDDVFAAALAGERSAVTEALSYGGRSASYLVLALIEYDEPRQMVYQDKSYNIFTSNARAQVRIVRSDGSIVVSRPQLSARGQGGTAEAAIQSALSVARKSVETDLSGAYSQLKAALD